MGALVEQAGDVLGVYREVRIGGRTGCVAAPKRQQSR